MRVDGIALCWCQSLWFCSINTQRLTVYERVLQRHHGDDKNVHRQREADDVQIEPDETLVLLETRFDEITTYNTHEEEIEKSINNEVDNFLASILKVMIQLAGSRGRIGNGTCQASQLAKSSAILLRWRPGRHPVMVGRNLQDRLAEFVPSAYIPIRR